MTLGVADDRVSLLDDMSAFCEKSIWRLRSPVMNEML